MARFYPTREREGKLPDPAEVLERWRGRPSQRGTRRVLEVLREGIATFEHADFVRRLAAH